MIPVQWRGTTCPITHRALVMNSVIPVRIVSTTIRKRFTRSRPKPMGRTIRSRHSRMATEIRLAVRQPPTFSQTQIILIVVIVLIISTKVNRHVLMLEEIGRDTGAVAFGGGNEYTNVDLLNELSFISLVIVNTMSLK